MAKLDRNGVKIHYEVHGSGPTILLSHGYSSTSRMWDGQVAALLDGAGVPYLFSEQPAMARTLDKIACYEHLRVAGFSVPEFDTTTMSTPPASIARPASAAASIRRWAIARICGCSSASTLATAVAGRVWMKASKALEPWRRSAAAMRGRRVSVMDHWVDVVLPGYPKSAYRVDGEIHATYMSLEIALALRWAASTAHDASNAARSRSGSAAR